MIAKVINFKKYLVMYEGLCRVEHLPLGLAREKLINKYPRRTSVCVVLALICMTGLAIFLISDLVSFALNPDHIEVLVGLELKGSENDIVSMTGDKEMSGNIGGIHHSPWRT